ncbi:hypothetical protein L1D13_19635 [Vibrio tubiashii]|uniref:hypothetical protein n=1 Tax=Vibrio TaxID=662 RepID=UPI000659B74D|nr:MULTISPECIES: hypothetical protein [Vibrio]KLN64602.1 hypothetical protein ZX61_13400 [Vibrio sp. VPAP30]MCG9583744.1 hypothetical protein [Vibrio tubiashii]MCG9617322.1 hypothetical protein [Vibrio tubiashii]MCG9689124.1 hypothetical protein [Vibrio tubiashii]
MRILIVGASKGLGQSLTTHFAQHDVVTLSRSVPEGNPHPHVPCDVTQGLSDQALAYFEEKPLDLVVYLPASWGESGDLRPHELAPFLATGPFGLLEVFHALNDNQLLKPGSHFVSIGSTAEFNRQTRNPCFALSKKLQHDVTDMLQSLFQECAFTHITLGSMGDDLLPHQTVADTIEHLAFKTSGAYPNHLVLKSKLEI